MSVLLAIFIGGGAGSLARFAISRQITSGFKDINPVGTLTANIISTVILGIILFLASQRINISDSMRALLITGFCGGFSTFSAFSYETFELMRTGQIWFAVVNVFISIALGIGVLFILARNL